ncbi:MAG: MopE-related protein, partial [Cyclobacteriaceae bacterium]
MRVKYITILFVFGLLNFTSVGQDTDNDGLSDSFETENNEAGDEGDDVQGYDPLVNDVDGDGLSDGAETDNDNPQSIFDNPFGVQGCGDECPTFANPEVLSPFKADSDGDGRSDGDEVNGGDAQIKTDPTVADSDGDGLNDGDEISLGTDPNDEDSDDDGLTDFEEADSETGTGTDPNSAHSDATTDFPQGDGINDGDEINGTRNGQDGFPVTDPLKIDSDNDGLKDGDEDDPDPNDPDFDNDGLLDGEEVTGFAYDETSESFTTQFTLDNASILDPNDPDSDDDGICDGAEIDIDGADPTLSNTWYADSDGDGFGNSESVLSTESCVSTGYVLDNTDCDDEDADVFPGAPAKADGKDNDCDGNIDKGDQTITFDLAATATFGAEPIALTASSTSELTVSLAVTSGPGTITSGNLTITGAGTIVVTASQAGDDLWNAAENVVRELVVAKASQTITFELQATATFGSDPITLSATSSVSTLAVEYAVDGPGKIEEGKLVITGAGTITVTASQPGNDNYSAAESVVRTVTVPKVEQTLTFELISEATFGAAPIPLTATSSQDTIKVILTVAGPATITDGVLTITGAGTITVTASHPGNDIIAAAESIVRTLVVAKASQSITFAAINDVIFGDAVISLSATSTSELAIEYAVTGPAELAGGNLTFTGPGTVTVTASQGGDENYAAAESVTNTFCVNPEMPTITNTNNVLNTGVTGTHTWFKDGSLIDGEVSNSLAVTESGTYSVTVTIGGCTSQSAEADAVVTGLIDDLKTSLKVYPNPTVSYLKLELHNTQQQPFNV